MPHPILAHLQFLRGSGRFVTAHSADFVFPGLSMEGLGEVSFPIQESQAKALIGSARKAPFGKGSETIVDDTVRHTWEIDADRLSFRNPRWAGFLEDALEKIKPGLGLEDYDIAAHCYKLLIYEPGSFFLPHRDSEKERGMFGTLVVELPSAHTGGELVVMFEGAREVVRFAQDAGHYQLHYAAFYADCEHEILPVTAGYRVSLVYNLVQQGAGRKIDWPSIRSAANALAGALLRHQQEEEWPAIILLGHQYTPENFSRDALKLNDRPKAAALLQAAASAGLYAKLCLVTSYRTGSPAWGSYDDDEDEVGVEIDDVVEEQLSIEHWAADGPPPLRDLGFDEEDLLATFPINEDEPIVKQSTGYMGNYGPDVMHWYHYGAVVVWSPAVNARLLEEQDAPTKLEWIAYFLAHRDRASRAELNAIGPMLSGGFGRVLRDERADYNIVAAWIMAEGDRFFFRNLAPAVTQSYFTLIDAAHWAKLMPWIGPEESAAVIATAMQMGTVTLLEQLLAVLHALAESGQSVELLNGQIFRLPRYFSETLNGPHKNMTVAGLDHLLWLEEHYPRPEGWVSSVAGSITTHAGRDFAHQTLVPRLLAAKQITPLVATLLDWCREFLQSLVAIKPLPPNDWSRELPDGTRPYDEQQWTALRDFLASPTERVFDFVRNQAERASMEAAIRSVEVDLKMQTIEKGRPYTLRITKTQAAYERRLAAWEEDMALLGRVVGEISK